MRSSAIPPFDTAQIVTQGAYRERRPSLVDSAGTQKVIGRTSEELLDPRSQRLQVARTLEQARQRCSLNHTTGGAIESAVERLLRLRGIVPNPSHLPHGTRERPICGVAPVAPHKPSNPDQKRQGERSRPDFYLTRD